VEARLSGSFQANTIYNIKFGKLVSHSDGKSPHMKPSGPRSPRRPLTDLQPACSTAVTNGRACQRLRKRPWGGWRF